MNSRAEPTTARRLFETNENGKANAIKRDSSSSAKNSNKSPSLIVNLVREAVAITLWSLLLETLPLAVQRIVPPSSPSFFQPHPVGVRILSAWLVYHATGIIPHAPTRICERRLKRYDTTLPIVLSLVLYCAFREGFTYYFHGTTTTTRPFFVLMPPQEPEEIIRLVFYLVKQVLQTALLTMSLLVLPVVLKLNVVFPKLWMLFPILAIPHHSKELKQIPSDSIAAVCCIQLMSGWLAGRWMNLYFPDDPTVEKLMKT